MRRSRAGRSRDGPPPGDRAPGRGSPAGAGQSDPDVHTDGADPERRRERRTTWLATLGVAALLFGLYGAAVALADDQLASGTKVADVAVGGLAPDDAARRLRTHLLPRATEPIAVSVAGRDEMLDPARAGLSVDVRATVERATGGSRYDPRTLWHSYFGGERVPPVLRVEQSRLIATLHDLDDRVGTDPVEPRVTFRGDRPVVRRPQPGTRLDVGRSAVAVRDAWLVDERTIELPVTRTVPAVHAGELRSALRDRVRTLVSAPIRLRLPDRTVLLEPDRYAPAISLRVVDRRLVTTFDEPRLVRRIGGVVRSAQRVPQPAAVQLRGGRPHVVPARPGRTVSPGEFSRAVLAAAGSRGDRTARVAATRSRPRFSTRDARALGIRRVVGSFTTQYPPAASRNATLIRAARLASGTVLRPGETFSLDDALGQRTGSGEVSEVATAVFNAAYLAGLEDVEHEPHPFSIDRYPIGRDATVARPHGDLRFRNGTGHGVLVQTWVDRSRPGRSGQVHARIWGTRTWDVRVRTSDRSHLTAPGTRVGRGGGCEPSPGSSGFEVDVHRDFYAPGSARRVRTETFRTRYVPQDRVVCR